MHYPKIEIHPDGEIRFRYLPPFFMDVLLELPSFLEEGDKEVGERLFPCTYTEDEEREKEWKKYARPDLLALFASRVEVVRHDLAGIEQDPWPVTEGEGEELPPPFQGFRLIIPAGNRLAWMSSMNAARLLIADRCGITQEDMEREPDFDEPTEKDVALLQIDLLGALEGMLVEAGEIMGS